MVTRFLCFRIFDFIFTEISVIKGRDTDKRIETLFHRNSGKIKMLNKDKDLLILKVVVVVVTDENFFVSSWRS